MDKTVLASIIGAASTIGVGILPYLARKQSEAKVLFPISNDRRKALQGKWSGTVNQYLHGAPDNAYTVDLDLEIKGRKIQGTGIINAGELYHVLLDGSFRNDWFLRMDYRNANPKIIQFGSFVFNLSPCSEKLTGRFVGYGHIAQAIIHGTCKFDKK